MSGPNSDRRISALQISALSPDQEISSKIRRGERQR